MGMGFIVGIVGWDKALGMFVSIGVWVVSSSHVLSILLVLCKLYFAYDMYFTPLLRTAW